jgi:hypothetical protein
METLSIASVQAIRSALARVGESGELRQGIGVWYSCIPSGDAWVPARLRLTDK